MNTNDNGKLSKNELENLLESNQNGEPFWSIMETKNGTLTGNFYTIINNEKKPLIFLFLAKYDADLLASYLNLSEGSPGKWQSFGISSRLLKHLMYENNRKTITFGLTLEQPSENGSVSSFIIDSKGVQDFLLSYLEEIKRIPDLNLSFTEWVLKYANIVDGPFIDNTIIKSCDNCWISKVIIAQPNIAGVGVNLTPMYCNLICKKNKKIVIQGKGITFKKEESTTLSLRHFLSRVTQGFKNK